MRSREPNPCIIELLAQPGPAHEGTVVRLCPRDHETHSIMKKPLSQCVQRQRQRQETLPLTFWGRASVTVCLPGSFGVERACRIQLSILMQMLVKEKIIYCATPCSAQLIIQNTKPPRTHCTSSSGLQSNGHACKCKAQLFHVFLSWDKGVDAI